MDPDARTPPTPGRRAGRIAAILQCSCGETYVAPLQSLYAGKILSCGCWQREQGVSLSSRTRWKDSHGLASHPLYHTWTGMMSRCYDPQHVSFHNYGGRGIKVAEYWHDVRRFLSDIDQLLGPRPERHTLDRKNTDGDYAWDNVQWASYPQQQRNKRNSKVSVRWHGNSWSFRLTFGGFATEEEAREAHQVTIEMLTEAGILR